MDDKGDPKKKKSYICYVLSGYQSPFADVLSFDVDNCPGR